MKTMFRVGQRLKLKAKLFILRPESGSIHIERLDNDLHVSCTNISVPDLHPSVCIEVRARNGTKYYIFVPKKPNQDISGFGIEILK